MKQVLLSCLTISCNFFLWIPASSAAIFRDTIPPVQIGGVPAIVVAHKNLEFNLYNSLSTQQLDTEVGVDSFDRSRASRFTQVLQINYGVSKTNRWNIGAELYYSQVRSDANEGSSPLKVLGNDQATGLSQRALSAAGIRLKGYPLRKLPELTLQSSLLFPTANADDLRLALDFDRIQWQLGANYYHLLTRWLHAFLQVDGIVRFANTKRDQTTYLLPINIYLVASVLEDRLYAFPSFSYGGSFEKTYKGPLKQINHQTLMGLGLHYRFSEQFSLTANYQFPLGYDSGSLTSELVKGSYWILSLGGRYVFAL